MSIDEFLDISPLELDLALREDMDYRFAFDKQHMELLRFTATLIRNKNQKSQDQIRDPRQLYPFWWEKQSEPELLTSEDWTRLDRKYSSKPTAN